jgi:rhodanese-related sulfurtransferase
MEEQAQDRREQTDRNVQFDPKFMPKIVDGSGDTPGPNHKSMMGRTWLSAQIAGGFPPVVIDIRPPEEWTAGHIKGALLIPGRQILNLRKLLPDPSIRVVIVDAEGGTLSTEVSTELQALGWPLARYLSGGWAEWVEFGEPQEQPTPLDGAAFHLGSPAALPDGRHGQVQSIQKKGRGFSYDVLIDYEQDEVALGVPGSKLKV